MPNTRSAKKRMRQAEKARARNRQQRSHIRGAIKKVREAGSGEEAAKALREATSLIDRAARKHLVHRNKAARDKARLAAIVLAK